MYSKAALSAIFAFVAIGASASAAQTCAELSQRNAELIQSGIGGRGLPEECLPEPKTFALKHTTAPQALQELATVLRTVLDVQNVTIDQATSSVTVHASTEQLALTDWLVRELNAPPPVASMRNVPVEQMTVPLSAQSGKLAPDQAVRVFFLAHTNTPQGIQEILTTLRTVADVQKVFNYNEQTALIIRADGPQMAAAAFMIDALDIAPGTGKANSDFSSNLPTPPGSEVKVFYLKHAASPQSVQQIITALRTVGGIMKVFNNTGPMAITVRGTATEIASSEWLIQALDVAADAHPTNGQYRIPGAKPSEDTIQVFYPGAQTTPAGLQKVVAQLRAQMPDMKVAPFATPPAVIVRGSPDQIVQSAQAIREQ